MAPVVGHRMTVAFKFEGYTKATWNEKIATLLHTALGNYMQTPMISARVFASSAVAQTHEQVEFGVVCDDDRQFKHLVSRLSSLSESSKESAKFTDGLKSLAQQSSVDVPKDFGLHLLNTTEVGKEIQPKSQHPDKNDAYPVVRVLLLSVAIACAASWSQVDKPIKFVKSALRIFGTPRLPTATATERF